MVNLRQRNTLQFQYFWDFNTPCNLFSKLSFENFWLYLLDEVAMTQKTINVLSTNPTKWPNTLKESVGKLTTNCLSVFGNFVKLALKGLKMTQKYF